MLLDDSSPEDVSGDGHRDPVVVTGEPNHRVREGGTVRLDHVQVELLPLCRITGRALEHRDLIVHRSERVVGRRTSSSVPPPVEKMTGLPMLAT